MNKSLITAEMFGRMPKIDLHVHLEGSLTRERVEAIAALPDNGITPEDLPWKKEHFAYRDLPHFIHVMQELLNVCLHTPEDYEAVMYDAVLDLHRQGAVYAEISFDPYRMTARGVPFKEVLDAVVRARDRAAETCGLRVGLILGTGREHGAAAAEEAVGRLLDAADTPVCGVDLHGNESAAPASEFVKAFAMAREAGLGIRVHAGEGGGAQNVGDAVEMLRAARIGHGLHALDDSGVMALLAERGTVLDMCPTSNLMLGLVPSLETHSFRRFMEQGVAVTVNTDDPLFFNADITAEYRNLHEHLGFTAAELERVTLHAVEGAFLADKEKAGLRERVVRGYKKTTAESDTDSDTDSDEEGAI